MEDLIGKKFWFIGFASRLHNSEYVLLENIVYIATDRKSESYSYLVGTQFRDHCWTKDGNKWSDIPENYDPTNVDMYPVVFQAKVSKYYRKPLEVKGEFVVYDTDNFEEGFDLSNFATVKALTDEQYEYLLTGGDYSRVLDQ